MNNTESLRLNYETRLREAPSNKLWAQYARWEASHDRIGAACVICERYLDSTADPSEDMWLLYVEISPSRSMKLDILARAVQQQPLSANLHHCTLKCLLSSNEASSPSITEIEHLFKRWMNKVLEHGTPGHLEALFRTLVDALEQLAYSSFIRHYEELVFLLLHAYATVPVAKNALFFAFNTIQQLVGQPGLDKRKLFTNALRLFTVIFPTIDSLTEQYSVLHSLYLLCEFMKPHFHSLFFAETLVCSSVNSTNALPLKSIYAFLFAARTKLEAISSPSVTELCLLLAYDALLTLQVDDRVFQSHCCRSIFSVVSSTQLSSASWLDELNLLQRIIASDLFLSRKAVITEAARALLLSRDKFYSHHTTLPSEELVQLYSSIKSLLQCFPLEPAACDNVEYLLDICLPFLLSNINQFSGLVEGLLQMLLMSPNCAQFVNKIFSIVAQGGPILFESQTTQFLLNAVLKRLSVDNLSDTLLAHIISCGILNSDVTTVMDILVSVQNKYSLFKLFQGIVRVIFDNTEAKSAFSTTIRCLLEIFSTLISNIDFRNDAVTFLLKVTPDLEHISTKDFLEYSAFMLLFFLTCMTQRLMEQHFFGDTTFESTLERILKRAEIVHIGVKMGDIALIDQYAKLSSLIGTVFEYHELITGTEVILGRTVLECVITVQDRERKRSLLLYEVVPIDRSDGHGLLKLIEN